MAFNRQCTPCLSERGLQGAVQRHPTPVLLPGKSHGWRSLEGCSPWGCWGSDMTEWLHFHFSLSCIGEGNGNPLQCSCLENPRDGHPGGLPCMGTHRVGHNWSDSAAAAHKPALPLLVFWRIHSEKVLVWRFWMPETSYRVSPRTSLGQVI